MQKPVLSFLLYPGKKTIDPIQVVLFLGFLQVLAWFARKAQF